EGRQALWDLIATADCLVENYRVGVLDKLGFGYEAVRQKHPDLVYCSISGFGQTGPWADRGGFDLIMQGMSSIMTFTGDKGSTHPTKCGAPITDIGAGVLGALGVVSALYRKQRTGKGDHVEASLLEAGIMFTYLQTALTLATGTNPKPLGTGYATYTPYEAFEAKDGWLAFGTTAGDASWRKLLELLDLEKIADDPRFASTADRVANRDSLAEMLTERLRRKPRDYWVKRFDEAGIPCGPVLTTSEMIRHEQVTARQIIADFPHAELDSAKAIDCPIRFAEADKPEPKSAPLLGRNAVGRGNSSKGAK
ncbi:MAG: CoA transferase, partial [Gammaproteobacteria bacterium]|nr:CoA transferase [Gammaproteobacteria bacterium]